jgi:nucleoside phosphorylase
MGVKLLFICPIPAEFHACREVLSLRDTGPLVGCRAGRTVIGSTEIVAIESGPAKARAACAVAAGSLSVQAQLVVDSGSCAGVAPGVTIGEILICRDCYEYDIEGNGFPARSIPEMKLPSAVAFLEVEPRERLLREAVEAGRGAGFQVRVGDQACGELLVRSLQMRETLQALFQAAGANWETAGVFVAALRNALPALSMRVVTDLGDDRALGDFRANVRARNRELYRYLHLLAQFGWFDRFHESWQGLAASVRRQLPRSVRP